MSLEVATYVMDTKVVTGSGAVDEVQVVTLANASGGTFTITFDGATTAAIAYNATAATVQTRLENLANIQPGDVTVTGSAGGPYTITFGGQYADTNVSAVTCSGASLTGTDEVQQLAVDATGGTFTVTFGGQTTAALAYDVDAATTFTAAMEGLSSVGAGNIVVSGGPGNAGATTPYVLTFGGALGDQNVAQITANGASLTGGAGTATPSTTTPGLAPTVTPTTSSGGVAGSSGVTIPDNIHADARNADALHNTTGDTPEDIFAAD